MHHFVKIAVVLCACIALSAAQFGHYDFSDFGSSYEGPSFSSFSASARDPRGNTDRGPRSGNGGPVLFPPSPSGDPAQTSGVRVGASGYGFVPPGSQGPAIRYYYRRRLYVI